MVFTKGHTLYLKSHTRETREKIRISKLGKKNPQFGKVAWNKGKVHLQNEKNGAWVGDSVTRFSLHVWIRNHFVKTGICEICHLSKKTEWSNKDHKYASRDRKKWQEACRSCHQKHDYKYLNRTRSRNKI